MQINRLAQYIEILLTEHTCVIVPELGGFLLQHFSARWEADMLLSPHTRIAFNPQLTHDDGTLVQAYMRASRLKYVEAKQQVHKDVLDLKQALLQAETVQFGRIGTLRMQEQNILFTSSVGAFLPDNFGMPSVRPIQRQSSVQPIVTSAAGSITFTIQRTTLRRVAACLIGLALLAIAPNSHDYDQKQYATLAPVNFAKIIEDRNAAIAAAEAAAREAELAAAEAAIPRGHFHVIVGTLEKKSADRLCQRLQTNGYKDACLFKLRRNQYRVAIASYHTKKEALREMRALRNTTAYKRAWVYCEPTNR